MDEYETQLLLEHPQWQRVLEAYLAESEIKVERDAEDTGPRWAKRVSALENTDSEILTGIHGQLIAMGWLKFQIEDRASGMTYRISSDGKKALKLVAKQIGEQQIVAEESIQQELAEQEPISHAA